jgi:hypothetical protein
MRRHRQRRLDGLRSLTIELRETEVDALIRSGFLDKHSRNDSYAVILADCANITTEDGSSAVAARDQECGRGRSATWPCSAWPGSQS